MKFLLLFFIFMVLLWQWRHARAPKVREDARKRTPAPPAVETVQCGHCGLHLPTQDASKGRQGWYCSVAHRQAQEP